MPFGLAIGTDRAAQLQQAIQDELTTRNYSADPDPVMAEYITIMIINDKTPDQITSELEDLIGSDFDPSFADWLFTEAAKGESEPTPVAQPATPHSAPQSSTPAPSAPAESSRRPPRNGVYQQAISQALPSSGPAGQKRPASGRSPSPSHGPNKSRRTSDVPTGPRAMQRDREREGGPNPRSLIDRVGGRFGQDDVQNRIDNIVHNPTPEQQQAMMMNQGFPMGMDMGMANPIMLQEMMMNQMALMAQMASTMGIINPAAFNGGMGADPAMFQGQNQPGMDGAFQGAHNGRGRGGGRGGRGGRGGGRGGPPSNLPTFSPEVAAAPAIVAPTPTPAAAPSHGGLAGYIVPERPQSPTLCKFGFKCTNAHCRYSHPSPVATAESGVVLSNEACENGKDCKDKDCVKAHVSPAVLNPQAVSQPPPVAHHAPPVPAPPAGGVACRFGAGCTRPGCAFTHPPKHPSNIANNPHYAQPCRFGSGCTRSDCLFQHPEGRVLPNSFHRGLASSTPLTKVPNPETGSIGAPSHNKSVKFNTTGASVKEKLAKQMKEIEEQKQAITAAQAKKEKSVASA
ncbi:hypothetical protein MKEN_00673900 [Mycena kentingensis (nom. inval.)]|nr:hypothetical protein MKEN_00673900 [Mycena kentingensis (nom. inval.)]